MRDRLVKWAIALTIMIGVPTGLIFLAMPYLDTSHATYLTAKGDYSTALRALDRAVHMDGGKAETYVRRSFVYAKLGEYQKAFADAGRAIEINNELWEAFNNRAWALTHMHGGDLELAMRDANRAVALCPSCAAAFDTRGIVELKQNQLQNSLADFNRAVEIDAHAPEYAEHRAQVLQKLGEADKQPVPKPTAPGTNG
jgi:tetratricopeptide (TPR) repeat protein